MRRLALLVALAAAPTAAALDALPDAARLGAEEARVVVRSSGPIHVRADAPIRVAAGDDAPVPAPAVLAPTRGPGWHGLDGAVELRLLRDDPSREVHVELDDGVTGVLVD